MPRRTRLPPSASLANPGDGGKLIAPSAARNVDAICDLVARYAPATGCALEIASGTGQHVVHLATACPGLTWHPTEIDPTRRASISAYLVEAGLDNVAPVSALDATHPGWAATQRPCDLIFLSNLLHLISETEARTLVTEAVYALSPGGVLIIYGPFMRGRDLTSDGDRAFHAALQATDPEIGYKPDNRVLDWGTDAGAAHLATIEMPANNLGLVWRRPADEMQ